MWAVNSVAEGHLHKKPRLAWPLPKLTVVSGDFTLLHSTLDFAIIRFTGRPQSLTTDSPCLAVTGLPCREVMGRSREVDRKDSIVSSRHAR